MELLSSTARCWQKRLGSKVIDLVGQKFLSLLTAVGLPTVVVALVGLATIPSEENRRQALWLHTVYFRDLFSSDTRVIPCDRLQQLEHLVLWPIFLLG